MYSTFSLNVDCMSSEIENELKIVSAPRRLGTRRGQPRCPKFERPCKVRAQALVAGDRNAIEIMEVLADILARIFEEAAQAAKIDSPSGSHRLDPKTIQTKEQLAA